MILLEFIALIDYFKFTKVCCFLKRIMAGRGRGCTRGDISVVVEPVDNDEFGDTVLVMLFFNWVLLISFN